MEWKPERGILREAEELARAYESVSDAGEIQSFCAATMRNSGWSF